MGKLNLRRGDWNSTLSTRIKNKLTKLDDIKRMYAHGSLRDRCLLLVLSQSGYSEVDITEFHIEDMKEFYEAPISTHFFIEKQREKTGETQATCLSYEAMHERLKEIVLKESEFNKAKGKFSLSPTLNSFTHVNAEESKISSQSQEEKKEHFRRNALKINAILLN